MDALTPEIRTVRPDDPAIAPILDRHLALMRASSPACSVHAMDADRLVEAGVTFFAAFLSGKPVAIGALKRIDAGHGELKSMHVIAAHRGSDLARAMLARLLDAARAEGLERVSLETGSQDAFAPARAFYVREGFSCCEPFEGYAPDPNSVFMTRAL